MTQKYSRPMTCHLKYNDYGAGFSLKGHMKTSNWFIQKIRNSHVIFVVLALLNMNNSQQNLELFVLFQILTYTKSQINI